MAFVSDFFDHFLGRNLKLVSHHPRDLKQGPYASIFTREHNEKKKNGGLYDGKKDIGKTIKNQYEIMGQFSHKIMKNSDRPPKKWAVVVAYLKEKEKKRKEKKRKRNNSEGIWEGLCIKSIWNNSFLMGHHFFYIYFCCFSQSPDTC